MNGVSPSWEAQPCPDCGAARSDAPGSTACAIRHASQPAAEPPASVIDTIDNTLREYLGTMDATSAAVQVWLALNRAGMLNKEFVVEAADDPAYPITLAGWARYLQTHRNGETWAVWADEDSLVQICRFDGNGLWATPRGHMQEQHMLTLGWKKVS